jgi:hypothetical protein
MWLTIQLMVLYDVQTDNSIFKNNQDGGEYPIFGGGYPISGGRYPISGGGYPISQSIYHT